MNYSKLGTKCNSMTNAITSNEKFFDIDDPIYQHVMTRVYQLPAFGKKTCQIQEKNDTENIKVFDDEFRNMLEPTIVNCKSCNGK